MGSPSSAWTYFDSAGLRSLHAGKRQGQNAILEIRADARSVDLFGELELAIEADQLVFSLHWT
jgi:hypothetical protein